MKNILLLVLLFQSVGVKADFNSALTDYENENYESAFNEFLSLAEIGEKRSQFNLGVMYYQGQFVAKDINKAFAWTRLATQQSDASEQEKSIHELIASKVTDKKTADAEYASLATNYASPVLFERLYPFIISNDEGTPSDAVPILDNKRKSRKKHFDAINISDVRYGARYTRFKFDLDKLGNPRNIRITESFPDTKLDSQFLKLISSWRFQPAKNELGEPINQLDLTYTIELRIGSNNNSVGVPDETYKHTKIAATKGDPEAQLKIGFWHKRLHNLPEELSATEWFLKSAIQGNLLAQYEIGESLISGKGCKIDKMKGIEWLTRAASNGQTDAKDLLVGLASADSSYAAQKQALTYVSDLDELSISSAIRLSWLLATSPHKEISNPKKAISLIEGISRKEYKDNVTKYEILAAAYAKLSEFDKAVDYQEEALDSAEYLNFDVTEIKQHLDLYKQNKKWF